MGWTHFEYTGGGNPYIAIADWKRGELLAKYKRKGYRLERRIVHGIEFYTVHDRKRR